MALLLAPKYGGSLLYIRKIKCPRHFILKPGGTPFVMEPDPRWIGKISEKSAQEIGFSIYRRKKDKWGQWIRNMKDYWQPEINPNLARERWFSPTNYICNKCKLCVTK
jgi:hypothetical protein